MPDLKYTAFRAWRCIAFMRTTDNNWFSISSIICAKLQFIEKLDLTGQEHGSGLRLAELMASLSLAIDLGMGQPMEWVLRSCLLGVHLSEVLRLGEGERQNVYYLTLLRHGLHGNRSP
jgi:hypothetical protein